MPPMIYDVAVVGGGITGAGVVRDAALRGLSAVLIEKNSPGAATTASSTHLIHGGLRYLLYDRLTTHTTCWDSGHIVRIARPLLTRIPILWPVYDYHRHGIETVETLLESYDGFQQMKEGRPHLRLTAEETRRLVPRLRPQGLRGGLLFDEWWVDPIALVRANLDSALRAGAQIRTGQVVTGFLRDGARVRGVRVRLGGESQDLSARIVVNAAGPWVDRVARSAGVEVPLRLRKGVHLIYRNNVGLSPERLGLLLEAEDRERYVFVIPGADGSTLVGPTDTPTPEGPDALTASAEDKRYLLASVRAYVPDFSESFDGVSVGARPLLGQAGAEKYLSREFEIIDHGARDGVPGLVTAAGGKMSDFRLMAEAAVDTTARLLGMSALSRTAHETLAGEPLDGALDRRRPGVFLKTFLRRHPRLREAHAWAYLAGGYARHWFRKLAPRQPVTADAVWSHYR